MSEDIRRRGTLSKIFSALGTIKNLTLETLGSWMWITSRKRGPNAINKRGLRKTSLRGFFAAVAFAALGHPFIGTQFKTAEEHLQEHGLDPEIANILSNDTQIHVRDRNLAGTLHSLTDIPTIIGFGMGALTLMDDNNAYMTKGLFDINERLFNTGMVTLPYKDITAKERISAFTGIPVDLIENVPVTDEEFYNFIVFHEFRHADDNNRKLHAPMTEADADNYAIAISEAVYNNPELENVIVACRAMHEYASSHNTGLYLDTLRDGDEVPAHWAFSQGSTVTVFGLAEDYISPFDPRPHFVKMTDALRQVLVDYEDDLSKWDVRRAELYIESAEYFAPSSVAPIQPQFDQQRLMFGS